MTTVRTDEVRTLQTTVLTSGAERARFNQATNRLRRRELLTHLCWMSHHLRKHLHDDQQIAIPLKSLQKTYLKIENTIRIKLSQAKEGVLYRITPIHCFS